MASKNVFFRFIFLFLLIGVFSIEFSSSELQVGLQAPSTSNQIGINLIPEEVTYQNVSNESVNASDYWNTDIGSLGTVNSTQFENNAGTLSIKVDEINVNSSTYSNQTTWWAGLKGWVSGWFINDNDELNLNETKLNDSVTQILLNLTASITFNASAVDTATGTLDGGNLTSIQYYDGITYNVSEVGGSPGFDIRVNFSNITDFNNILARFKYDAGIGSHQVIIQLYDYDSSSWEDYATYSSMDGFIVVALPVFDPTEHIENGTVQFRFYHPDSGSPQHDIFIDWVALQKGFTTFSGNEHDSLSGRNSTSNHPWAFDIYGTRRMLANLDMGLNDLINATNGYFFGNVGIGTSSPISKLEINGSDPNITLHNYVGSDSDGSRKSKIVFTGENSTGFRSTLGIIEASHEGSAGDGKGEITFFASNNGEGDNLTNDILRLRAKEMVIRSNEANVQRIRLPGFSGGILDPEEYATWGRLSSSTGGFIFTGVSSSGSGTNWPLLFNGITNTASTLTNAPIALSANKGGFWAGVGDDEPMIDFMDGLTAKSRIMGDGSMGIKTLDPQNALNVLGDGNFTGSLYSQEQLVCLANGTNCAGSNQSTEIVWTNDSSEIYIKDGYPQSLNVSGNFFVNGTTGMVGVGTNAPLSEMTVQIGSGSGSGSHHGYTGITLDHNSNAMISILSPSTTEGIFGFGDNFDTFIGGIRYAHSSDSLSLWGNNVQLVGFASDKTATFSGDVNITGNTTFNGGWINGGVSIINGDGYFQSLYAYNISALNVSTLNVNGSIVPPTGFDNTFDIGEPTNRWKDGHFGGIMNVSGDGYFGSDVGIGTSTPIKRLHVLGDFYSHKDANVPAANYVEDNAWILRDSASPADWNAIEWSPELGIFVALAFSGPYDRVMTSSDGVTWFNRTEASTKDWRGVKWSPELGLFVAVAASGTGNRVMTSSDGITWTSRASAADNNWFDVEWSPELGLFVAVAGSGTNRVMTSSDGITWTDSPSASEDNFWFNVEWSPELGLFVAVAISGNTNRVMVSSNGINWTNATAAEDNDWRGLEWSPELGLFVAVARTGTNRVMTSPNGVTWTSRTAAAANQWYDVAWSPELGLFSAIAASGTGNRVMTSSDGITWTSGTSASDDPWIAVAWSAELGMFASVATAAVGKRVMTSVSSHLYPALALPFRAGIDQFIIDENGSVGIGTPTPQNTLNVIGHGNFTGALYSQEQSVCLANGTNCQGSNQTGEIVWTNDSSNVIIKDGFPDNVNITGTMYAHNYSANSDIVFINGSADEIVRFTDDGKVGIGTDSPEEKLTLDSGNLLQKAGGTNHSGNLINGTDGAFLDGASDVYVSGKYAYVASYDGNALEIVDVSDPANPTHVGVITNGSGGAFLEQPEGVYVSGKYAYVSSYGSDALEIVDVSDPSNPTHAGVITNGTDGALLDGAYFIYVSGKYAYVASIVSDALEIVDVSDPSNPTHAGVIVNGTDGAFLDGASDVYVVGDYAYVVSVNSDALQIIDISDKTNPTPVGVLTNGSGGAFLEGAFSLYVSGKYAYVASSDSYALEIVDISDPTSPTHVGVITNGSGGAFLEGASDVYILGRYAYIASDFSNGIEVVDVSNVSNPTHVDFLANGSSGALLNAPNKIFVSGKYLYVASYTSDALEIVDITGVDSPSANIGSLAVNLLNVWENLNVFNDLYVGNGLIVGVGGILSYGSLSVGGNFDVDETGNVNISNEFFQIPENPRHVSNISDGQGGASLDTPNSVYVQGDYAYIADIGNDVFEVVDISDKKNPKHAGSLSNGTGGALLQGAYSVFVKGDYAYVACDESHALEIINISDPTNPTHAGVIVNGTDGALLDGADSVYIVGNYAYVVSYSSNALEIVDISDPTNPTHVGVIRNGTGGALLGSASGVYVEGDYAYVASFVSDALEIINVSNKTNPTHVSSIVNGSGVFLDGAYNVYVKNDYAYVVSFNSDSFSIINVSNVSNPTQVGVITNGTKGALLDGASFSYVSTRYAYISSYGSNALEIIDISDPTNPIHAGEIRDGKDGSLLGGAFSVFVQGKYAYVASSSDHALEIVEINGIDSPSASIGDLETNKLFVREDADVNDDLYVGDELFVGGNVTSAGNGIFENVGIGTTINSEKLEIDGNISILSGSSLKFAREDGDKILLVNHANESRISHESGWVVHSYSGSEDSASSGVFKWSTHNGSKIATERVRISNNGNVGIGTTNPTTELEVVGDIKATGFVQVKADSTSYTSGANAGPEIYEITSGGPACNATTRGQMFVGRPSAQSTQDSLCVCLLLDPNYSFWCINP